MILEPQKNPNQNKINHDQPTHQKFKFLLQKDSPFHGVEVSWAKHNSSGVLTVVLELWLWAHLWAGWLSWGCSARSWAAFRLFLSPHCPHSLALPGTLLAVTVPPSVWLNPGERGSTKELYHLCIRSLELYFFLDWPLYLPLALQYWHFISRKTI